MSATTPPPPATPLEYHKQPASLRPAYFCLGAGILAFSIAWELGQYVFGALWPALSVHIRYGLHLSWVADLATPAFVLVAVVLLIKAKRPDAATSRIPRYLALAVALLQFAGPAAVYASWSLKEHSFLGSWQYLIILGTSRLLNYLLQSSLFLAAALYMRDLFRRAGHRWHGILSVWGLAACGLYMLALGFGFVIIAARYFKPGSVPTWISEVNQYAVLTIFISNLIFWLTLAIAAPRLASPRSPQPQSVLP